MSDEPVFTPMRPAIPSRATGEDKPLAPAGAGLEEALRLQQAAQKGKPVPKKDAPTRKQKRAVRKLKRGLGKKAVKQAVKNPNRPLELKSQMHALLEGFRQLKGPEHEAFTNAVRAMQDLTKPGRKHVLEALARVYG